MAKQYVKFLDTKLLRHPLVEEIFQNCSQVTPESFAYQIRFAEILSTCFENPDPSLIAAGLLKGCFVMRDSESLRKTFQRSAELEDKEFLRALKILDEINDSFTKGFNESLSLAARQWRLVWACDYAESLKKNMEEKKELFHDYSKTNSHFRHQIQALLPLVRGRAGVPDLEAKLEELCKTIEEQLKHYSHTVPAELNFEQSGLPDCLAVRAAFDLMLQKEIDEGIASNSENLCLHYIDLARSIVENGWSSDPDIITAALLKNVYISDKFMDQDINDFRSVVGDHVVSILEECMEVERHQPYYLHLNLSDEAKIIAHVTCLQELNRWNRYFIKWTKNEFEDLFTGKESLDSVYLDYFESHVLSYRQVNTILCLDKNVENPEKVRLALESALKQGQGIQTCAKKEEPDSMTFISDCAM